MTKESKYLLGTSFLLATACVVYLAFLIPTKTPCSCNDTDRYATAEEDGKIYVYNTAPQIAEAQRMVNNFKNTTHADTVGTFISKRVFDKIFCNIKYTGIVFYFAQPTDKEPRFKLFFEGLNRAETKIPSSILGTDLFRAEVMCPKSCGRLNP